MIRLTDRPDMTLAVSLGGKTITEHKQFFDCSSHGIFILVCELFIMLPLILDI